MSEENRKSKSDDINDFLADFDTKSQEKDGPTQPPDDVKPEQKGETSPSLEDINEISANIKGINRFYKNIKLKWETIKILSRPVLDKIRPLARLAKWAGNFYMSRIFYKYAYNKDAVNQPVLNPKKAAKTIVITIALIIIVYHAIPLVGRTIRDTYHIATSQELTLFFGKPTFNSMQSLYQVTACESQSSCEGGDNALIFDIPDNNALDLLYTFTRAKGYDPEHEIVSAFNSEYQKCKVTAKGKKPIIINYVVGKYIWHPKIIDKAVCTPVVNMGQ